MKDKASGDAVDLWSVRVPASLERSTRKRLTDLLDEAEVARMRRFRRPKDRDHYLVAHALCRTALSAVDETVRPSQWRFEVDSFGKPHLATSSDLRPICFNLSHACGICVVVVGSMPELGVDVEFLERKVDRLSVARHSFAPAELRDVERLRGTEQRDQFFRYWTLKEAYIKARGLGMRIPLQDFAFDLEAQPVSISFVDGFGDMPSGWHFVEYMPAPLHRTAVALRSISPWVLHTHSLAIEEL